MPPEVCKSIRKIKNCKWKCKSCEEKADDIKALIESMQNEMREGREENKRDRESMRKEMREGREEDRKDRDRIYEGLKTVEDLSKRMDNVEEKQESQKDQILTHDKIIKQQVDQIKELEQKVSDSIDMDQLINKAAVETAERERRGRNFLVHYLAEADSPDPDEKWRMDKERVEKLVIKVVPKVKILRIFRIGEPRAPGEKPRTLLVTTEHFEQARAVINASFSKSLSQTEGETIIHCTKDRSLNQRNLRQNMDGKDPQTSGQDEIPQRGRGNFRGRPRGRSRGGRGARGARGARGGRGGTDRAYTNRQRSDSRKRSLTGEVKEDDKVEKRQKINDPSAPLGATSSVSEADAKGKVDSVGAPNLVTTLPISPIPQRVSLDGTAGDPMTPPASLDDPEQIRSTQTSFIALEETINDSTNLHSTVVEKSEKEHSVGAKSGPKAAAKN